MGPRPPVGIHRYALVLFKQKSRMSTAVGAAPPASRANFNTRAFAAQHDLGLPVAAVYFNAQKEPAKRRRLCNFSSNGLRLALQTAKALLALHSAEPLIIHRDVKSADLLIDRRFNARLGDFGLALCDDSAALFSAAHATPPAGTLGYLDPSYVTPENLSTKTDVFSFGILQWRCLQLSVLFVNFSDFKDRGGQ